MIKVYIVAYTVFLICLGVYIYSGDGSKEHRKNIIIIGFFAVVHVYLLIFFMFMKPEIKSFISQMKSAEFTSVENPKTASASKSAGVERIIRASPQRSCTCVVNIEDIDTVVDAANIKDELLYGLFVNLGTVIIVREDTRVSCYFSESYRGLVPVIFWEGEYKGRRVYVPEKRLQEQ